MHIRITPFAVGVAALALSGAAAATWGATRADSQTTAPRSVSHQTPSTRMAGRPHVTIMVGGIDKIIYLPAKLADQLGYFKKAGVDVTLVSEGAGVDATNELLAGKVDGVVGFYDHTIDLQGKGKFLESVVQLDWVPGEAELIATGKSGEISSPANFTGHTLGITGIGSSTDLLTQYLGVKSGVQPSSYTRLPVGAGDTLIAALEHGQIDGGMTTQPTIARLLSTGSAKVLVNLQTAASTRQYLGGTYPAASLYMRNDWVQKHPDVVQRLANAFVWTLKWIHTHKAGQIAAKMPHDYYAGGYPLYLSALKASVGIFTPDGMMPADGPKTVLRVLSTFDPNLKGRHIDLSKTYTTRFVGVANNTAPPR